MSRPTDYNEEIEQKVLDGVRQGLSSKDAALCAGISETSFFKWLKLGREGNPVYAQFAERIEVARAEAKQRRIKIIYDAEPEDPRLALEMLARMYPQEFGKKVDVTSGGQRIQLVISPDLLPQEDNGRSDDRSE